MAEQKIITVLGATGTQGCSVLQTFLESTQEWRIRAVTRNPNSHRAQQLAQKSDRVELVQADTADKASLVRAFTGASAIFSVTDYWAPFGNAELRKQHAVGPHPGQAMREWAYANEVQMGMNVADAAAEVMKRDNMLEHFVWSGLPSPKKVSHGKYSHIYHFDSKAEITERIQQTQPELAAKMSVIYISFYASNLHASPMMVPQKKADGTFLVSRICPGDAKHAFIVTSWDTGLFVYALIKRGPGSKPLLAYTAMLSWKDLANFWAEAVGKTVEFQELTVEEMKERFPVEGEELLSAKYSAEFGYAGKGDDFIEPKDLGIEERLEVVRKFIAEQDWSAVLNSEPVKGL